MRRNRGITVLVPTLIGGVALAVAGASMATASTGVGVQPTGTSATKAASSRSAPAQPGRAGTDPYATETVSFGTNLIEVAQKAATGQTLTKSDLLTIQTAVIGSPQAGGADSVAGSSQEFDLTH